MAAITAAKKQALAKAALKALKAARPHLPPGIQKKLDDLCNDIEVQFGGGGGP